MSSASATVIPSTAPAPIGATELVDALAIRDLSDPASGPHAMQLLLDGACEALASLWRVPVRVLRPSPIATVADNYDNLGYSAEDVTRQARYTRYLSADVMLRSHTSAGVPPVLRDLARRRARSHDEVIALPGLCYRRDSVDRLHVGTPHQLDLWRVTDSARLGRVQLLEMAEALVEAVLPGARWRAVPATHPYTIDGHQIDVLRGEEWVELAECGVVAAPVLRRAGLDPRLWNGLALGMGLDRAVMLRTGVPDIRMLRAANPRIAKQMLDLEPWQPVSAQPEVRRDLSLVLDAPADGEQLDELLGDPAREALGCDADVLESLVVLTETAPTELPTAARRRLRIRPGQVNALVRLTLRPLDRTLTDAEANVLRDRVYRALHRGEVMVLITLSDE
ncbi:PheS-related mystery ligase SrmL [Luethyella okanaganae]|uniref:FDX-ACB domain-containing protein n=1 Tax=Luethyella okanaganae TaxID=69372 RepID=A0ABW1VE74_9MICO